MVVYCILFSFNVQCYILMDEEWSQNIQNTDTVLERSCSVIPPRAPCEEGGTVIIIMFCHLYLLLRTDLTITPVQTPGGRRRTVCSLQIAMQRWMYYIYSAFIMMWMIQTCKIVSYVCLCLKWRVQYSEKAKLPNCPLSNIAYMSGMVSFVVMSWS